MMLYVTLKFNYTNFEISVLLPVFVSIALDSFIITDLQ